MIKRVLFLTVGILSLLLAACETKAINNDKKGNKMKKAIVLGADNGYMDKVETTIKSVCAHNDHIKFYVFNDDLP